MMFNRKSAYGLVSTVKIENLMLKLAKVKYKSARGLGK
jgi:hypothetical protein